MCPWDEGPSASSSTHQLPRAGSQESTHGLPRAGSQESTHGLPRAGSQESTHALPRAGSQEVATSASVSVPEIRVHAASSVEEEPVPGTSHAPEQPCKEKGESSSGEIKKVVAVVSDSKGSKDSNVAEQTTTVKSGEEKKTKAPRLSKDKAVVPSTGERSNEVCPWEDE